MATVSPLGSSEPIYIPTICLAAQEGNLDAVKQAVKSARVTGKPLNLEYDIVNSRDTNRNTPIEYAASTGHLHIVKFLCSEGAIEIQKACERAKIAKKPHVFKWLEAEEWNRVLDHRRQEFNEKSMEYKQLMLSEAIQRIHKGLITKLLSFGIKPDDNDIREAPPEVKKLLEYRPCKTDRRHPSILELIRRSDFNVDFFLKVVEDEANTSDEGSSDEEVDDLVHVPGMQAAETDKVLYRGIHFSPNLFSTRERREAREIDGQKKLTVSFATKHLTASLGKEKADEEVKKYFAKLKKLADQVEKDEHKHIKHRRFEGEPISFSSLYFRFIQAYVNSYDSLFLPTGIGIMENFKFQVPHNPLLSTSKVPLTAWIFSQGIKHLFIPKFRKSTLEFKHRRIGCIQVFKVPADYYNEFADDINSLDKKEIAVKPRYRSGEEVVFYSSIPDQFLSAYQLISYPSMRSWSPSIEENYGISEDSFKRFKRSSDFEIIGKTLFFQYSKSKLLSDTQGLKL